MKLRLRFRKEGLMQYIGHLDFMRAWQKFFRRSGIPIAYSEGFSPHQIFSIASPLSVGITGEHEYLDLKLSKDYDLELLKERVNAVLCDGMEVLDVIELPDKARAAMAACQAADYEVYFSPALDEQLNLKAIDAFFRKDSIPFEKTTKKGKAKVIDLKEGIYTYDHIKAGLFLRVATGSSFNIKPEFILTSLFAQENIKLDPINGIYYRLHRKEIYQQIEPLASLIEFEEGCPANV